MTWKTKNVIKHDTFMPTTVSIVHGIQQVQARLTMVAVIQGSDRTLSSELCTLKPFTFGALALVY